MKIGQYKIGIDWPWVKVILKLSAGVVLFLTVPHILGRLVLPANNHPAGAYWVVGAIVAFGLLAAISLTLVFLRTILTVEKVYE